jgi:hypothetical protein
MENKLVWITNTLTTKIFKEFSDKYILYTIENIANGISIGDIIIYRWMDSKTYICLGKVISCRNKKIAIQKMEELGNHYTKSKMLKLLSLKLH